MACWVACGAGLRESGGSMFPPLESPPAVLTTASKGPVVVASFVSSTVRDVGVAAVTVPMAPLLKMMALADGMEASKPLPLTMRVVSFIKRSAAFAFMKRVPVLSSSWRSSHHLP